MYTQERADSHANTLLFQMSLDVLRVLAKSKGRFLTALTSVLKPTISVEIMNNPDRCCLEHIYISWPRYFKAMYCNSDRAMQAVAATTR